MHRLHLGHITVWILELCIYSMNTIASSRSSMFRIASVNRAYSSTLTSVPDDGVCPIAAWNGGGFLPRRAEDLQRGIDIHLSGVFYRELHHLRGDHRCLPLRVIS